MSPSDSGVATFSIDQGEPPSMESNNWRPAQDEPPSMDVSSSNWRSQLQPEARQRIVKKIMDTIRRHCPVVAPGEGMTELKKIAVRFEEKIYVAAVNQSDYLRKISLKMISLETKTLQNTPMNPQPGVNQNSTDAGVVSTSEEIAKLRKEIASLRAEMRTTFNQVKPPAFIAGGRFVLDYLEHVGVLTPEMVGDPVCKAFRGGTSSLPTC
ncbi:hypothetical protein M5K25_011967 [Dendrobium thyrsiflorum]|uniref:Mediator complex subunit 15 KIX domain-containing protein n=1 Tax=Dendrobium thyrsiflorum TaxID=117978 RepID=A0ABD0VBM0_DENTH